MPHSVFLKTCNIDKPEVSFIVLLEKKDDAATLSLISSLHKNLEMTVDAP